MPGISCSFCCFATSSVYNQEAERDHIDYASVASTCKPSLADPFMFAYTKGKCPLLSRLSLFFLYVIDNGAIGSKM